MIDATRGPDKSIETGKCDCDWSGPCNLCEVTVAKRNLKNQGIDVDALLAATKYKNPKPTVDAVVTMEHDRYYPDHDYILLVKRKNPPHGYALPGGFVNEGESFEAAAVREIKEETGVDIHLVEQFHTYSDPKRDPRQHNSSTVYLAEPSDLFNPSEPKAGDDAAEVTLVTFAEAFQMDLAFDHKQILRDVLNYFRNGGRPRPCGCCSI